VRQGINNLNGNASLETAVSKVDTKSSSQNVLSHFMKRQTILIVTIVLTVLIGVFIFLYYLVYIGGIISSGVITTKLGDKPQRIVVRIDNNANYPNSMELKMTGEINGVGILCIGWNDSVCYRMDTISNNFLVKYDGDWYDDSCIIKYKPISATKGELKIDYKIYSERK